MSSDGSSMYSNVSVEIASDDVGDGEATFAKLITFYELMEMQGDLSPIDAKLKDYLKDTNTDPSSASGNLPLPLGTFILPKGFAPGDPPPTKKSPCCLRLGTLSLEGEVGPPIKPMAVLKRIEKPSSTSETLVLGSKRPRGDDHPLSEVNTTASPSTGIESFSSWWGRRSAANSSSTKGTPEHNNNTVSFELVGVIKKRFHFKTKPTRQF